MSWYEQEQQATQRRQERCASTLSTIIGGDAHEAPSVALCLGGCPGWQTAISCAALIDGLSVPLHPHSTKKGKSGVKVIDAVITVAASSSCAWVCGSSQASAALAGYNPIHDRPEAAAAAMMLEAARGEEEQVVVQQDSGIHRTSTTSTSATAAATATLAKATVIVREPPLPIPIQYGTRYAFDETVHEYAGLAGRLSESSLRRCAGYDELPADRHRVVMSTALGRDLPLPEALLNSKLGSSVMERWATLLQRVWLQPMVGGTNSAALRGEVSLFNSSIRRIVESGDLPYLILPAVSTSPVPSGAEGEGNNRGGAWVEYTTHFLRHCGTGETVTEGSVLVALDREPTSAASALSGGAAVAQRCASASSSSPTSAFKAKNTPTLIPMQLHHWLAIAGAALPHALMEEKARYEALAAYNSTSAEAQVGTALIADSDDANMPSTPNIVSTSLSALTSPRVLCLPPRPGLSETVTCTLSPQATRVWLPSTSSSAPPAELAARSSVISHLPGLSESVEVDESSATTEEHAGVSACENPSCSNYDLATLFCCDAVSSAASVAARVFEEDLGGYGPAPRPDVLHDASTQQQQQAPLERLFAACRDASTDSRAPLPSLLVGPSGGRSFDVVVVHDTAPRNLNEARVATSLQKAIERGHYKLAKDACDPDEPFALDEHVRVYHGAPGHPTVVYFFGLAEDRCVEVSRGYDAIRESCATVREAVAEHLIPVIIAECKRARWLATLSNNKGVEGGFVEPHKDANPDYRVVATRFAPPPAIPPTLALPPLMTSFPFSMTASTVLPVSEKVELSRLKLIDNVRSGVWHYMRRGEDSPGQRPDAQRMHDAACLRLIALEKRVTSGLERRESVVAHYLKMWSDPLLTHCPSVQQRAALLRKVDDCALRSFINPAAGMPRLSIEEVLESVGSSNITSFLQEAVHSGILRLVKPIGRTRSSKVNDRNGRKSRQIVKTPAQEGPGNEASSESEKVELTLDSASFFAACALVSIFAPDNLLMGGRQPLQVGLVASTDDFGRIKWLQLPLHCTLLELILTGSHLANVDHFVYDVLEDALVTQLQEYFAKVHVQLVTRQQQRQQGSSASVLYGDHDMGEGLRRLCSSLAYAIENVLVCYQCPALYDHVRTLLLHLGQRLLTGPAQPYNRHQQHPPLSALEILAQQQQRQQPSGYIFLSVLASAVARQTFYPPLLELVLQVSRTLRRGDHSRGCRFTTLNLLEAALGNPNTTAQPVLQRIIYPGFDELVASVSADPEDPSSALHQLRDAYKLVLPSILSRLIPRVRGDTTGVSLVMQHTLDPQLTREQQTLLEPIVTGFTAAAGKSLRERQQRVMHLFFVQDLHSSPTILLGLIDTCVRAQLWLPYLAPAFRGFLVPRYGTHPVECEKALRQALLCPFIFCISFLPVTNAAGMGRTPSSITEAAIATSARASRTSNSATSFEDNAVERVCRLRKSCEYASSSEASEAAAVAELPPRLYHMYAKIHARAIQNVRDAALNPSPALDIELSEVLARLKNKTAISAVAPEVLASCM